MSIDPSAIVGMSVASVLGEHLNKAIKDTLGEHHISLIALIKEQNKLLRDIADHTQADIGYDNREAFLLPLYASSLYWQVPTWKRAHFSMMFSQATTLYVFTERLGLIQRPIDPSKNLWYQVDLPVGTQLSCNTAGTNVLVRWTDDSFGIAI